MKRGERCLCSGASSYSAAPNDVIRYICSTKLRFACQHAFALECGCLQQAEINATLWSIQAHVNLTGYSVPEAFHTCCKQPSLGVLLCIA